MNDYRRPATDDRRPTTDDRRPTTGERREAGVVLRLMLSAGFLEDVSREDEMDIEAGIFEEGLALPTRVECMGFFVDRLEVGRCSCCQLLLVV